MLKNLTEKIIYAIETKTKMIFTVENEIISFDVEIIPDYYEMIDKGIVVYGDHGDVWEIKTDIIEYDDKLECYITETSNTKMIISFK